jgi:multiple sugar transport system permease protein
VGVVDTRSDGVGRPTGPSPNRGGRALEAISRLGAPMQLPVVFVLPYLLVFVLLVLYPIGYGFYLGSNPANYLNLFGSRIYLRAVVNTVLFVGIGVNLKMFLALLLSGFFASPKRRWPKALLLVFLLPWAIPALPGFLSIHWMFDANYGLVNTVLGSLGLGGTYPWLVHYDSAFAVIIGAYVWKNLPFWTVLFLAARLAVPKEVYEAAAVDGASGVRRFLHVTFPLVRNVYITSTLLSTIWALGDYNTIRFITNGGPFNSTQVFATLGITYAFEGFNISRGVSVVLTALPLVIPLVALLVHRLRREAAQ